MSKKDLFISIHGIDGSGKTTTSNTLTSLLNAQGIPTLNYDEHEVNLNPPYRKIKKEVKAADPHQQFLFFLASTLFHSQEILKRKQTSLVVKSRYLLDVLAHHADLGVRNVLEVAKLFPFVQPDLLVILVLNEKERLRRVRSRLDSNDQDLVEKKQGNRPFFMENYFIDQAPVLHPDTALMILDTTIETPQQIATRIAEKIHSLHV
jgi:thymidylate kinase